MNKAKYHINYSRVGGEPLELGDYLLYQVGRMYCEAGGEILQHRHGELLELTVVTGGSGSITVGTEEIAVAGGFIHASFVGELHAIRSSESDPLCYDFVSFWARGEELSRIKSLIDGCIASGKRGFSDGRVARLVTYMIEESMETELNTEALSALVRLVLLYTERALKGEGAASLNVRAADSICFRVMRYVDANLFDISSLEEVAGAMNYSYGYLSSLFSRTTGRTLTEYYTERRFAAAQSLLLSGVRAMEVASRLGFSSVYTFSRAYKNRFGYPPTKTREIKRATPC